jgi:hypothetical protein
MADYEEESDESSELQKKTGLWNQMKENWPLVFGIIVFIWQYREGNNVIMNAGVFYPMMIIIGGYAMKWMEISWKFHTPKVVMNPIHSSCNSEFDEIGGYGIIRLGAIRYGIEIAGRDGTVIAPLACFNRVGRNIMIQARVQRVQYYQLPPDVSQWVIERRYPEPYFIGYVDDKIILHHPEVTFVTSALSRAHSYIHDLEDRLDQKGISYEKYASHIQRMASKGQGNIFTRAWKRTNDSGGGD